MSEFTIGKSGTLTPHENLIEDTNKGEDFITLNI